MAAEVQQYKGKPTICLNPEASGWQKCTFGVAKAELILDNIIAIFNFVGEHGNAEVCEHFVETIENTNFTGEEEEDGETDPT